MKLNVILASLFLAVGICTVAPAPAKAAVPIDDAYNNRIIDDQVFLNSGAMSAGQIQTFLNSKVASCGNGFCLRNYSQGGKSAAQIIADVSGSVGVNPQVLLATLQKEQSLVTNPAPSQHALGFAMGYGCPEGPGCNPAYNGFTNQVTLGARLLRAGTARNCGDNGLLPGWWVNPKWRAGQTVTVDGRATLMETCATGSLYNYTPHRPDSAYRGATNGVLYFGNYNFIKNFTAWFGSTWNQTWRAQYLGQTNPGPLTPGQSATVSVTYKNVGTTTWTQGQVRLGTANPPDRASGFAGGSGWIGNNRVQMQEASVAPGQDAHFVFALTGNPAPGNYAEYFRPVAEGIAWMENVGQYFPVSVVAAANYAQLADSSVPDMLSPTQGTVTVRYRNLGASTWSRTGPTPFRLGTDTPHDHVSALYTAGQWLSNNRVQMREASVPPFGIATFTFTITAPGTGRFTERFTPVIDGMAWLNAPIGFTVETGGSYAAQWAGQSDYPQITPGQTATVFIDYKNTGTATWYNNGPHAVRLGTDNPPDRISPARHSSWPGGNRAATLTQTSVAPGQTGRFSFTVTGPPAGFYREYFRPVAEGRTWFGPANSVYVELNTAAVYSARWVNQSAPAALFGSTEQTAWIEFRNTGNRTWQKSGANPIRLGTANPLDRASGFVGATGWLTANRIQIDQTSVAPGQVGRFTFTVKKNGKAPGTYREYFRPVIDGVAWLDDWGVWLPFTVN